jgi:hypothetical protein
VRSGQELPRFFCDPDWSYQQINWSLKERRMVSLNFVSKRRKTQPPTKKLAPQIHFIQISRIIPKKIMGMPTPWNGSFEPEECS